MRCKHFARSRTARLDTNDVVAEAGVYNRCDFAHGCIVGSFFKSPGITVGYHDTHKAASLCRVFVDREFSCGIFVAYAAFAYFAEHRIGTLFRTGFVFKHYVAHSHLFGTVRVCLVDKTVFNGLRAHVWCCEVVAVFEILLLYFGKLRNAGMFCIGNLELIVDKELQIFVDRLLLKLLCGIFVVEVFKFSDSDIMAVNSHKHCVGLYVCSDSRKACQSKSACEDVFFHQ